jgi:hypothetical protein
MSNEIYYNRSDWETRVLNEQELAMLDARYIITDEIIATREIEVLYVKYITMIDPLGYIEFSDGTRLSTSIDLLNNNNIFLGSNLFNQDAKFQSFYIKDGTQKESKIYQQGNVLIIDNNNLNSSCYIQLYDSNGRVKRITFDQNGNITLLNNVFSSVYTIKNKLMSFYSTNAKM